MKLRKGSRLTTKSNPYYIKLSNTYSLPAEFSDNLSQTDQITSTESKFKLIAAVRRQEKMNNQIHKYIINTRYNDTAIINTAIKIADDECNVMNKSRIYQRDQVGKAFSTGTHQRNRIITRDVKNVHFKSKPSISTYQQHDKIKMLTYDSGADGHYFSEKDRKQLGLPILIIPDKKVGVANGGV